MTDVDAVETCQSVAHGVVAALGDVVDQLTDRSTEVVVEDVVEPTVHQGTAGLEVHLRPPLPSHHAHRADAIGRAEGRSEPRERSDAPFAAIA